MSNKTFTSYYNINIVNSLRGYIYAILVKLSMKDDRCVILMGNNSCKKYNFIIKVQNVQMVYSVTFRFHSPSTYL